MKSAAVFFDRDNTLIVNDGYLGDPAGVRLAAGAARAVARAHAMGFAVVVASNQSGVARGMFDERAVEAVNARMAQLLLESDPKAAIDRQEFCPFHPDAVVQRYRQESDLRKPRPGMLLRAAAALDLDLPRSWMIGDSERDMQAGKAAGCRTILLQPKAGRPSTADSDATVGDLAAAMDWIAAQQKSPRPA
jgi:D,D-heptose 1,7-bisphosphate phosphatase